MTNAQPNETPVSSGLRKSRWFRVTLRGLFLLVAVAASAFGWLAFRVSYAREDEEIIARLVESHGQSLTVSLADPFDADATPEMAMFYQGGPAWLTKLLGADIFRATAALTCYAPGNSFSSAVDSNGEFYWKRQYVAGVTSDELSLIAKLRNLKQLQLEANPVDDEGVREIAKLPRLESLNLSHTAITNDAIITLTNADTLRDLNLSYTDITDQAMESLAQLDQLDHLNVEATRLSAERVSWLEEQLPNCEIAR